MGTVIYESLSGLRDDLRLYAYWLPWKLARAIVRRFYGAKDNALAWKLRFLANDYDTRPEDPEDAMIAAAETVDLATGAPSEIWLPPEDFVDFGGELPPDRPDGPVMVHVRDGVAQWWRV